MKKYIIIFAFMAFPFLSHASNPSGTCGDNATWYVSNDTLYIMGSGDMNTNGNYGDWRFRASFKYLVFSDSITSISSNAFQDCSSLKEIFWGKGIRSIGKCAFWSCTSLTSIVIPDYIKKIGNDAFYECSNLTSIVLGEGIEEFGSGVFTNCSKLGTIEWNVIRCNHAGIFPTESITSFTFGENVIEIPASLCYNMKKINSVVIPNSVTKIGRNAFKNSGIYNNNTNWENDVLYIGDCLIEAKETLSGNYTIKPNTRLIANNAFYCPNLLSISCPESLNYIGDESFAYCSQLTSIDNIVNVLKIGDKAFYNCTTLNNMAMTNTVTSLGVSAFEGCTGLSSITLSENIDSINDKTFKNCSTLVSVKIPNNSTSIGMSAFENNTSLSKVIMNNMVRSIKTQSFYSCSSLDSINFPSELNVIEQYAFQKCTALQHVTFNYGLESIGLMAFNGCTSIDSVFIPISVRTINAGAFFGCLGLKYVLLPDSLEYIDNYTFSGDTSLCEVTIGEQVKSMGYDVFSSCKNLKILHWNAIHFPDNSIAGSSTAPFRDCKISELTFGENVECIPRYLTYGCSLVKSLVIPHNVTKICQGALVGCSSLDTIIWNAKHLTEDYIEKQSPFYGKSIKYVEFGDEVEYVPNYLFVSQKIKSVNIPNNITRIGRSAFASCSLLKTVNLPDSLTFIDTLAFSKCSSITEIFIPNKIQKICLNTFQECTDLAHIGFGDSLKTIESYAFYGCWNMRYVEFPKNVTAINTGAFSGCTNINRIILHPTTPPICQNCALPTNVPTYIPCGTYNAYSQSDWANYQLQYSAFTYSVNGVAEPITSGNVQIETPASVCETVKIEAIPHSGYYFVQWEDGLTDNPRYEEVTQDTTFVAIFAENSTSDGFGELYADDLKPQKILRDGQIFILRSDRTYTIQGQEVK